MPDLKPQTHVNFNTSEIRNVVTLWQILTAMQFFGVSGFRSMPQQSSFPTEPPVKRGGAANVDKARSSWSQYQNGHNQNFSIKC